MTAVFDVTWQRFLMDIKGFMHQTFVYGHLLSCLFLQSRIIARTFFSVKLKYVIYGLLFFTNAQSIQFFYKCTKYTNKLQVYHDERFRSILSVHCRPYIIFIRTDWWNSAPWIMCCIQLSFVISSALSLGHHLLLSHHSGYQEDKKETTTTIISSPLALRYKKPPSPSIYPPITFSPLVLHINIYALTYISDPQFGNHCFRHLCP